ncbi:M23 family peptidase [Psychrobacillus glaciei]|uniref:M23 family peptidase n=1 Tax=Psychrobacillus glaciei TaxID=2283160 RepID=A0A5J6SJN8_9BACI|nr:M23 family metallopeptidase [Psychrobacillus glaciei]QFF98100.1 M23 family peptidase [Psychrobacillus glaciei]
MRRLITLICSISAFFFLVCSNASAAEEPSREQVLEKRMDYYIKYSSITLPWYYLAAIDQYERNIQQVRNDIPTREGAVAIQFSDDYWTGLLNPIKDDTNLISITFFEGNGADGNKDGFANRNNDDDVMLTMSAYLSEFGSSEKDFKKALKEYYQRDQAVDQIIIIAKIYKKFETTNLDKHAFPLDIHHNYSYKSTWGDSRGWGGRRIHEGTDLFASYGVPVKSTAYGIVETMGWNDFGGWRIGIRDIHNTYHYFAHLSSYQKGIKVGDILEPGAIIGYVGSSGYGKEGTAGKFPPHLHYGMYKFNGRIEWAYDPFPSLKRWEQEERKS